jgi:hypothetical protein
MRTTTVAALLTLAACDGTTVVPGASTQIDSAQSVRCLMPWTTYGRDRFAEEVNLYEDRDSSVILTLYRYPNENVEEWSEITAPLNAFAVVDEESTGLYNMDGDPVFNTTFEIVFADATWDDNTDDFFLEDGSQNLAPSGDIWLHFVASEGEPISTNLLVAYEYPSESEGECVLVTE